jgi:multiple sugar transport system substrate-binding protein
MSIKRREFLGTAATAAAMASLLPAPAIAQGARLPNVTIWVQSGPEAEALKLVADAYTKATGNPVTIGVQGRAGWRQRYETALAAGSREFDGVLHISRLVPALAAGGLIAPLDEFVAQSADWDAADLPKVIQDEMKFDGKWFMAPTDITLETLVYRTDLIPSPPKTWEELRETAKRLTQTSNPASPTRYGYAYSANPGNVMGSFLGAMGSYGADWLDARGCVTADSPAMIAAWSMFIGMKNADRSTPPDINAWDYPELLVGLQNGTLAMASFFTAGMPVLTDCAQTPGNCRNLALVAQPAGPGGSKTRVNPLGVMVNAASQNKAATWAFLRFATGKEGGRIYTQGGGQSPRLSLLGDPALAAARPWTPEVLKAANAGVGTLRVKEARELGEAFDRFAQQAVAGQITPEQSLRQASAEMRQIMGNQRACT